MSELTTRLGLSKPADGDTDWGDEIRGALDIIDKALISHYFGENAASHSGLNFAYLGGVYRNNTNIATIAAGSIALTDDATNYIFVDVSAGAIAANTTGFTAGDIPLFTVVTATGAITNVTDNRTLLSADVTLAHNHDASYAALGHDHNLEYASASHDHDTDYYTKTELGGVADGTAGADLIGATPITSLGEANTVQGILEALAAAGGGEVELPMAADPFKPGVHSGLDFAYGIGIARADNVVARVNAGTVTLADDATNYVEVTTAGVVSANTTGYTAGRIPLYTVTTSSGAITTVQDDRCFFNVAAGGGGNFVGIRYIDGVEPLDYSLPAALTVNITIPVSASEGDLLIVYVAHRDTIAMPSGWVEVIKQPCYGDTLQWSSIWYKICGSADIGDTITITQASSVRLGAGLAVFRSSTELYVESSTGNTINSTTLPSISATADVCLAFLFSSNASSLTSDYADYYIIGKRWAMLDSSKEAISKRMTASFSFIGAETAPTPTLVCETSWRNIGNAAVIFKLS
jgi:hypothetical protein